MPEHMIKLLTDQDCPHAPHTAAGSWWISFGAAIATLASFAAYVHVGV